MCDAQLSIYVHLSQPVFLVVSLPPQEHSGAFFLYPSAPVLGLPLPFSSMCPVWAVLYHHMLPSKFPLLRLGQAYAIHDFEGQVWPTFIPQVLSRCLSGIFPSPASVFTRLLRSHLLLSLSAAWAPGLKSSFPLSGGTPCPVVGADSRGSQQASGDSQGICHPHMPLRRKLLMHLLHLYGHRGCVGP